MHKIIYDELGRIWTEKAGYGRKRPSSVFRYHYSIFLEDLIKTRQKYFRFDFYVS